MPQNKELLQMCVGEAKQRDVGKKRARIGPEAMDFLHVAPGEIIQLKGKRLSCAIVWPIDEDEKNPDTIMFHGIISNNKLLRFEIVRAPDL